MRGTQFLGADGNRKHNGFFRPYTVATPHIHPLSDIVTFNATGQYARVRFWSLHCSIDFCRKFEDRIGLHIMRFVSRQNYVFQLISTRTPCDRHMVLVCNPAAKIVHTGLLLITN
jgi:hypothetical protein